jgi:ribonuclease VapC
MIIDTSALLAILLQEPEAEDFTRTILKAPEKWLSAASLLETGIIIETRYGSEGSRDLDLLLSKLEVKIMPVSERQAQIARKAYQQYGKGFHPAALNYGDCFVYALAKEQKQPLLFKGNDFSKTDIKLVPYK